jgi:magnesium transporter
MEELEMQVNQIEQLIAGGDLVGLEEFLNELNISEVEELIDELPEHGSLFIESLNLNRAVNVFRILDFPTQNRIFKKLSKAKISALINELPPDDRTSFFSEMKDDIKHLILLLPPKDRVEALALLGYPEDSVGRLMTPDYITVKEHWSIERILGHIRRYGRDSETIDVLYVIDGNGKLVDDIRIKDVLMAEPDRVVGELIDHRLISLNAYDPQE